MKVQKLFTLDHELVVRLAKEDNASLIVNKLVKEYYEAQDLKKLTKEQLLALKEAFERKMQAEKDMEVIQNGP